MAEIQTLNLWAQSNVRQPFLRKIDGKSDDDGPRGFVNFYVSITANFLYVHYLNGITEAESKLKLMKIYRFKSL